MNRYSETIEAIEAVTEQLARHNAFKAENRRQRDLLDGITPAERELLNVERDARMVEITAELRRQNDELEAELIRSRGLRVES